MRPTSKMSTGTTDDAYARLLDTLDDGDRPVLMAREYLDGTRVPPSFVILCHDVDRKPQNWSTSLA